MHVAGVNADARTFEHLDPELVGNEREMLVSELSGKGTVLEPRRAGRARRSTTSRPQRALRTLKEREHRGYHYEAAPTPRSSCCCAARPAPTSPCSSSRASG